MVIYFIGDDKGHEKYIELIRQEILNNTKMLISIYRERIVLAEKIGEIKKRTGKPVRDLERELLVKDLINPQNELENAFLNMVFESTILAQLKNYEPSAYFNRERFCVRGDREFLLMIASKIICKPGDEIHITGQEEPTFVRSASLTGSHIIIGEAENYDFRINLKSFSGTEDIGFIDSDTITISFRVLTRNKICARIRVEC
ncbi:MAG: chorismate mutase [Candidatus Thermoplasmatota archaeon]|nr:chorismate mutase [Candidatus Thermoplasmatota archaeon]